MLLTLFTQVRQETIDLLVAYSLSNNCTEKNWNQTTTVKTIVEGWVAYFLQHTLCTNNPMVTKNMKQDDKIK